MLGLIEDCKKSVQAKFNIIKELLKKKKKVTNKEQRFYNHYISSAFNKKK
jgi:hypothetical protein